MEITEQPLNQHPEKKPIDHKIISLIFISLLTNAALAYVLPFYPYLANKEAELDYAIIGILMSLKSVGSLVASYTFGTNIQVYGRKKFLLIALISQSVVMALYAILYFLTDYYWVFLGISIVMRLLEGVMRSIQQVIAMAYLNIFYKPTFAKKFSMMESTASFGQVIGPVLGSGLEYLFGYWIPLIGLAVLYWICSAYFVFAIPSDDQLPNATTCKKKKLPLGPALAYHQVLIIFATLVVSRATVIYFNSFFTNHMLSYGIEKNYAALMISIPQTTYMISIVLISYLLKKKNRFRFYFQVSIIVGFAGCVVLAPAWKDVGEIQHIWAGLVLIGFGAALNRLPSIPVFQQMLKEIKLSSSTQQEIIDMASALLQMSLSVSNLLFPSIGGFLYSLFQDGGPDTDEHEMQAFRFTILLLAMLQILMFMVDMIFNRGWQVWQQIFFPVEKTTVSQGIENKAQDSGQRAGDTQILAEENINSPVAIIELSIKQ